MSHEPPAWDHPSGETFTEPDHYSAPAAWAEVRREKETEEKPSPRLVTPPPPRMACVYIAGPFSGVDGWEIACNVHRAEALAREVVRLGAAPLTPHSIGARMAGTETYEFWCAATMELMRRCDAVIFTVGWEMSRGARGEHREAVKLGMPCFFDQEDSAAGLLELKWWLDKRARQ